jgi:hypothetical protein
MSTNTPFAYNTGSNIPGTQKIGNISYGTPTVGFESSGLKWWNGPDEDLGYVIAKPDPSGLHVGGDDVQAYLGFRRSTAKTEASFIELANNFTGQTFVSGDAAKTWLNSNGYWTSWGVQSNISLTGAFAYTLVTLPYQPPAPGNIIFPNFSNQSGPGNQGLLNPNTFAANAVWWNKIDSTSTDRSNDFAALIGQSITLSFTQNGNTAIYTTNGLVLMGDHFNYSPNNPNFNITLVQASPVDFIAGQLVTISYAIN